MTTTAYRNLRDLPPIEGEGGACPLPTEAKRLAAWVEALPRANAAVAQRQLGDALDSLVSQRLGGATRLEALEILRRPAQEAIAQLEREFIGAALPLPPGKHEAARQAERFHLALAHGYRLAAADLCAPAGKVPLLRGGSVAIALGRAMHHYARALAEAWRIYHAPQPGSWQGLHRCHAFAQASRLGGKVCEDPLDNTRRSLDDTYRGVLLVSLCNPYAHSQAEQETVWSLGRAYAPHCPLASEPGQADQATIDADGDHGPGVAGGGPADGPHLDIDRLRADIDAALGRDDASLVRLLPSRGVTIEVSRQLAESIRRSLGQATAARIDSRLRGGHRLDCALGLSVLHYHLAGRQDFDAFVRQAREEQQIQMIDRAAWAHGGGDALRTRPVSARVLDQSLHGYRLAWDAEAQARARVSELVGLSLPDEPDDERDWMIGIVRWLRHEDDGGVSAGVELLARRAWPVALCGRSGRGDIRPPLRALALLPLDGGAGERFLSQASGDFDSDEVEILRASRPDDPVDSPGVPRARLELIHNGGDYVLYGTSSPVPESFS